MGEILEVLDRDSLMDVCIKAHMKYPDTISPALFYEYLRLTTTTKQSFVLVSREGEEMTGCVVLSVCPDFDQRLVLSAVFMWVDPHYPRLFEEFLSSAEGIAKMIEAKEIIVATSRKAEPFMRKYGKYGFELTHSVFKKKVI